MEIQSIKKLGLYPGSITQLAGAANHITVNGQHYPAIVQDAGTPPEGWAFANLINGFVTIQFS